MVGWHFNIPVITRHARFTQWCQHGWCWLSREWIPISFWIGDVLFLLSLSRSANIQTSWNSIWESAAGKKERCYFCAAPRSTRWLKLFLFGTVRPPKGFSEIVISSVTVDIELSGNKRLFHSSNSLRQCGAVLRRCLLTTFLDRCSPISALRNNLKYLSAQNIGMKRANLKYFWMQH